MSQLVRHVDDMDWDSLIPQERAVLCFIVDDGRILLIDKKTGLGSGKVNGPGGRIEPGETAREAAVRETQEETGITPHAPRHVANLQFVFTDGYSLSCDVFVAHTWAGQPSETREARPFWCSLDAIPYTRMWEDDALWLPRALAGEHVVGKFVFEGDRMLSHRVAPA